MTILFYSVSARKNELSKTLGTATSLTGTLREPVSLTDPEILIESATVPAYNYAYISDLGRYYFIRSVVAEQYNMYRLALHVDVLMTYKGTSSPMTGIRGLYANLRRSETNADAFVPDRERPTEIQTRITSTTRASTTGWAASDNMFDPSITSRNFVCITEVEFNPSVTTTSQMYPYPMWALDKVGLDALYYQYVNYGSLISNRTLSEFTISLMWLPFQPTGVTWTETNWSVDLPVNNLSITGQLLPHGQIVSPLRKVVDWTVVLSLPQTTDYWLNYAPQTEFICEFQPFGRLRLDNSVVLAGITSSSTQVNVYFEVVASPVTGDALLYYKGGSGPYQFLAASNVGIALPVSAATYNIGKLATGLTSSLIAVAGGIASQNFAAAAGGAVGMVGSLIGNESHAGSSAGAVSKFVDYGPKITTYTHNVVDPLYDQLQGKPRYARSQIGGNPGYVEVEDVFIGGTGFGSILDSERTELESILKAGIFV